MLSVLRVLKGHEPLRWKTKGKREVDIFPLSLTFRPSQPLNGMGAETSSAHTGTRTNGSSSRSIGPCGRSLKQSEEREIDSGNFIAECKELKCLY
jgi:hypothetical protein